MLTQNLDNLSVRLSKEETEASLAIYDMCGTGAIYQNQNNYEFYTISRETGNVLRLDRFKSTWIKQVGLSFKFMYSTKWKKVQDE
jgi:hypothetical protein